eukprot:scaffold20621_cov156-Amphora_coffeaeformis.AAC.4
MSDNSSNNNNDPSSTTDRPPLSCPCCASWRHRRQVKVEQQQSPHAPVDDLGQFFVLRNAHVYTLDDGNSNDDEAQLLDVWVGGGKIWALTPSSTCTFTAPSSCPTIPGLREVNLNGCTICPGLVDMHQHIVGGGGEAGFATRTPEANVTDLIEAGVTTFVATLGTDTVTRGMENLVAQTRALSSRCPPPDLGKQQQQQQQQQQQELLTGRAWLGGYAFPMENTITGSIRRDVTLIPEIIGVGELAISDHRGSYPSTRELTRLASEVRVAGMLAGKAGVTYLHMGEDASGLQPLREAVQMNPLLQNFLVPTHMERSPQLVQEGWGWMQAGGRIDFSGWPERQRPALRQYMTKTGTRGTFSSPGASMIRNQLSISSDSYGSINVFDEQGKLVKYSYGLPNTLLRTFMALVYEDKIPLGLVLRWLCRNPASVIGLDGAPMYKGQLRVGGDADLLVLKLPPMPLPDDYPRTQSFDMDWPSHDGILQYVIAQGVVMKSPSSASS